MVYEKNDILQLKVLVIAICVDTFQSVLYFRIISLLHFFLRHCQVTFSHRIKQMFNKRKTIKIGKTEQIIKLTSELVVLENKIGKNKNR